MDVRPPLARVLNARVGVGARIVPSVSPLDRVTVPRVVAHAFVCDTLTAAYLLALRWEAGTRGVDLPDVRGHDRRAWNRQIGEQAVNACILLSVLPCLLSGFMFWSARLAWAGSSSVWVVTLCWVPVSLAIGGLVLALLHRGKWRAWTADEVAEGLVQASVLRFRQGVLAGAVLVAIVGATIAGWL
ncbi:MAG: hypothetical protein WCI29_13170 [Actinomycetes bacterium]